VPLRCWPVTEHVRPRLFHRLARAVHHVHIGRHLVRHRMPAPSLAKSPATITRLVCRDVPGWLKSVGKAAAVGAPIMLTSPPVAPPVQAPTPGPALAAPGAGPSVPSFGPSTAQAPPETPLPAPLDTPKRLVLPSPTPPSPTPPSPTPIEFSVPAVPVIPSGSLHISPVPEPASYTTFIAGLLFLICLRTLASWKRRNASQAVIVRAAKCALNGPVHNSPGDLAGPQVLALIGEHS
jgi:hypothetical protein